MAVQLMGGQDNLSELSNVNQNKIVQSDAEHMYGRTSGGKCCPLVHHIACDVASCILFVLSSLKIHAVGGESGADHPLKTAMPPQIHHLDVIQ